MSLDSTLRAVLDCVCTGLTLPPCRCYATAGEPVIDQCCECLESEAVTGVPGEGEATVSLVSLFDADVNGVEGIAHATVLHPCRGGTQAANIVVSLSRCHPTLDATGDPPDPAELDAAATQAHTDAQEMRTALACCPTGPLQINSIGTIRGPEGGCIVVVADVDVVIDAS